MGVFVTSGVDVGVGVSVFVGVGVWVFVGVGVGVCVLVGVGVFVPVGVGVGVFDVPEYSYDPTSMVSGLYVSALECQKLLIRYSTCQNIYLCIKFAGCNNDV